MDDVASFPVRHAVCAALLAGLCAGIFVAGIVGPAKSTDDWRRTAKGWERSSGWSNPARSAASFEPAERSFRIAERLVHVGRRTDAHPAALALAQLVGSMLALAIFSPRSRSLVKETTFFTLVARSFRASVFGS